VRSVETHERRTPTDIARLRKVSTPETRCGSPRFRSQLVSFRPGARGTNRGLLLGAAGTTLGAVGPGSSWALVVRIRELRGEEQQQMSYRHFDATPATPTRVKGAVDPTVASVSFLILLAGLLLFAARPAEAQMTTGTYTGNGVAGRPITGLSFQPDIVLIKVDYQDATTQANAAAVLRTSTMSGDISKPLMGLSPLAANLIQSLDAHGFPVGNELRVKALNSCGLTPPRHGSLHLLLDRVES